MTFRGRRVLASSMFLSQRVSSALAAACVRKALTRLATTNLTKILLPGGILGEFIQTAEILA